MTKESKQTIIAALQTYRGDDYNRAKAAFRGYTTVQMNAQYGMSGKTCHEVLESYRIHDAAVKLALEEVQSL